MHFCPICGDDAAPFAFAQLQIVGVELLQGVEGVEAHGSRSLGFIIIREQSRTGDVSGFLCLQLLFGDEGS